MTIREIQSTIEEGRALKDVALAYTEIASLTLRRIRHDVLRTRVFFSEVLNIYALVRQFASKSLISSRLKSNAEGTVCVIITSNNRFFGHMDKDVIQFFLNTKPKVSDTLVIGHGGIESLKTLKFTSFKKIEFKKDLPDPAEMAYLVTKIKEYRKVLVYYAKFQTVLKQVATFVDITQSQAQALANRLSIIETAFILEPEAKEILDFFDKQLRQVLLEQTFLEAELARTGSRLISMDQAQHNADEFLDEQQKFLLHAKRSLQNARILETVASMQRGL